jgi:hypothetical protein
MLHFFVTVHFMWKFSNCNFSIAAYLGGWWTSLKMFSKTCSECVSFWILADLTGSTLGPHWFFLSTKWTIFSWLEIGSWCRVLNRKLFIISRFLICDLFGLWDRNTIFLWIGRKDFWIYSKAYFSFTRVTHIPCHMLLFNDMTTLIRRASLVMGNNRGLGNLVLSLSTAINTPIWIISSWERISKVDKLCRVHLNITCWLQNASS